MGPHRDRDLLRCGVPALVRAQVEAGALADPGADAAPTRCSGFQPRPLAARARALENQCFVAIAPTVGDAPCRPPSTRTTAMPPSYGPVDRGFPEDGVLARGALMRTDGCSPIWTPHAGAGSGRRGRAQPPRLARRSAARAGDRARMTLVYLVAGEASGDVLGGKLAAALAARRPDLRFAGVGGRAHGGARPAQPVSDAGTGVDGLAGGAAQPPPSPPAARRDRRRHRGETPGRGRDDRQPRLRFPAAESDPAARHSARPLRGAAGLGLARKPRPPLPRFVGDPALPSPVRAGILRPAWLGCHLRRPPGPRERRRHG